MTKSRSCLRRAITSGDGLLNKLVYAEPENAGAKDLLDVFEQLGYQYERQYAQCVPASAQELKTAPAACLPPGNQPQSGPS